MSRAQSGQTVSIPKGDKLVVELKSNPSTGYGWQVSLTDDRLGYPMSATFPGDPQLVGGSIREHLIWDTSRDSVKTGDVYNIILHYLRSWEGAAVDEFKLRVKIV